MRNLVFHFQAFRPILNIVINIHKIKSKKYHIFLKEWKRLKTILCVENANVIINMLVVSTNIWLKFQVSTYGYSFLILNKVTKLSKYSRYLVIFFSVSLQLWRKIQEIRTCIRTETNNIILLLLLLLLLKYHCFYVIFKMSSLKYYNQFHPSPNRYLYK